MNCFFFNSDESWLKPIYDDVLGGINVECTMGPKFKYPTIYIRFDNGHASQVFSRKIFSLAIRQYLTNVGVFDLEGRKLFDFVGVATGKTTCHLADCRTLIPTYSQQTLYGRAHREPARIFRAPKNAAKA